MSLYVVERETGWCEWVAARNLWGPCLRIGPPIVGHEIRDCNERDGEWPAFITLAHETVEWDGRAVPLFEGDVERIEWERRRGCRRYTQGRRP